MRFQRLTLAERYQIAALHRSGISMRAIGKDLNRSPATISRELKRNYSAREYRPQSAQFMYVVRRKKIHPPLRIQGAIADFISSKLSECQWSPEQIAGRLKMDGVNLSHETIYKFVYKDQAAGGELYRHLRRRRKRRRSRKASKALKRCGKRLSYPSISERPEIVERRERLGDFERDTVLGRFKGPVLLTIVDRCSRLTKLSKVEKINANLTHEKTVKLLKGITVHTITNDNGPEFADYAATGGKLNAEIFFTDPYASWQRGTNENTNGLIRQYYPKGTDFSKVPDLKIKKLEALLNNRPRKILGFKTPNEVHKLKSQSVALST